MRLFGIENLTDDPMPEDLGTPPPFRKSDYETWTWNQPAPQQYPQHIPINTNTYISVGVLLTVLTILVTVGGGIWSMGNKILEAKTEITTVQMETRNQLTNRLDKADARIDLLANQLKDVQSNRGTILFQDFFKWCVHLQKDNPQIKVPEPESQR